MPETSKQQPNSRILVVDDDPAVRLLMRETLTSDDITVEEAADGLSALAAFDEFRPHLMLLDVRMPNMDGFSVCEKIRKHPAGDNVTVIMVTGLDDHASIEQAYQVGATDFITKPITWPIFSHRVRYLLRAGEAFATVRLSRIELELNERLLREAQHIGHMGNWTWDIASGDVTWSDEIFHIFGHKPGSFEPTHERFIESIYPQDVELIEQSVKGVFMPDGHYSVDYRITLPNGQLRWVHEEAVGKFDDDDNLLSVRGTVQDITERKQTMQNLTESEARFRRLADNALDMIYRMSLPEGRYEYVSPAATELFGYTPQEFLNSPKIISRIIHPDWRQDFEESWERLLLGDMPPFYEFQIIHKSGETRWLNQRNVMVRGQSGHPIAIEGIVTDVTAQKLTNEALRHSEQELRNILDNMLDIFFRTDIEGRMVMLSPSVEKQTGWKADDLIGKYMADLYINPDGWEKFIMAVTKSGGKVIDYITQFRHKNNELKWVSSTAQYYYDAHGKIAGVEGIVRDITAQKELQESQSRLAEILQATPDIVGTMNMNQRVLYLNSSARQMFGYKINENILNLNLHQLHTPAAYKYLDEEGIPTAIQSGTWTGQNTILTRDNIETPVWQTLVAHPSQDGDPAYISFVMHDMTELLKKEAQLLHDQKLTAIGEITSGIAHDFGNLMTVLKGNLQLLDESLKDQEDAEIKELLEDARSASEDGAQLTRQLLTFSRKEPLAAGRLAAHEAIRKFRSLIKRSLNDNIKLSIRGSSKDLPDIFVDSSQFESALLNVVINARDAMPNGGSLTIRIGQRYIDADSGTDYAEQEPGDYIAISVTDTGVGMDNDTLDHACDPFFTTKTPGQGTGLGLSMVYGFVKQSGGRLLIDSTPKQGTTITLLLPVSSGTKQKAAKEILPEAVASNSETVLLVEDRAAVRRFARRSLEQLGYKVLQAENAKAARKILKQSSPIDLLFSDILMPGRMNGRELAHWVTKHYPRMKILLTTASEFKPYLSLEETQDIKSMPLLKKPYSKEELARELSNILQSGNK